MRIKFIQKIIGKLRKKKRINSEGKNNIINAPNKSNIYINIYGDNNKVTIKTNDVFEANLNIGTPDCPVCNCEIYIEEQTTSNGLYVMLLEDNQKVFIDKGTMISDGVEIWASDTHTILDKNKNIINRGSFVHIGKHCWIGMNVKILKNTKILDNTICGYGAIVSGEFNETNCILAGVPAKIVKRNVSWDKKRIKQYEAQYNIKEKA